MTYRPTLDEYLKNQGFEPPCHRYPTGAMGAQPKREPCVRFHARHGQMVSRVVLRLILTGAAAVPMWSASSGIRLWLGLGRLGCTLHASGAATYQATALRLAS